MDALFQLFSGCAPEVFQKLDGRVAEPGGRFLSSQIFSLKIRVVETVEEEV